MLSYSFKLRQCMVFPFDNSRNRHTPKTTVFELDLTQDNAWSIIKDLLDTENIILVHFAPPCGTASAARSRPISEELKQLGAPEPKPLRSKEFPQGLPWLHGLDKIKVDNANKIYQLCVQCIYETFARGIPITLENPPKSLFWDFPGIEQASYDCGLMDYEFHGCMYGGCRKRLCRWRATGGLLDGLNLMCDGSHEHKPWSITKNSDGWNFSTAEEAAYPFELTEAVAYRVVKYHNYTPNPAKLNLVGHSHVQATIQAGKQPRSQQSLISEFADVKEYSLSKAPSNAKFLRDVKKGEKRSLETPEEQEPSTGIYGIYRSPEEFVQEALKTVHPMDSTDAIEINLKKAIEFLASKSPADICKYRLHQLKIAREWVDELRLEEEQLHKSLEENIQRLMQKKRLLLFHKLMKLTEYPEADNLFKDMCEGFELVGKARNSKCLPKKIKPALISVDELQKAALWNRKAVLSKCKLQNDETDEILWQGTQDELAKGWVRGPFDESQITEILKTSNWIAIRRFALKQGEKIRVIDDCKEARINTALTTPEKLQLMGVDHLVITALALAKAHGYSLGSQHSKTLTESFVGRTLDLTAAYKNLACAPGSRWASVLVIPSPLDGLPKFYISDALMFGSTASVYAFNRCARALWYVSTTFLSIVCTQFYDDFPCLEKVSVARSSRLAFEALLNLLGWPVSDNPQKALDFAFSFKMLGVQVDVSHLHLGKLVVSNLEKRTQEILADLSHCIEERFVDKSRAASLFGKLNFAMSSIFGRGAAPGLRLLSDIASGKCNSKLCGQAVQSLKSISHFLVHAKPRTIQISDNVCPVCIFTDASYEEGKAQYGVVMFCDSKCYASSGFIPEAVVSRWRSEVGDQVICQAELYPIVLVKSNFCKLLSNRRCLYFIDNDAARFGLVKMSSVSTASVQLIHLFYNIEAENPSYPWFARVPSASNPADEPSRGKLEATVSRFNADIVKLEDVDLGA